MTALLVGHQALFLGDQAKSFLDGPDKNYALPASSVFVTVQGVATCVFLFCCTLLPLVFRLFLTLGACEDRIRQLEEVLRCGQGG
jgi:hypothetical protein